MLWNEKKTVFSKIRVDIFKSGVNWHCYISVPKFYNLVLKGKSFLSFVVWLKMSSKNQIWKNSWLKKIFVAKKRTLVFQVFSTSKKSIKIRDKFLYSVLGLISFQKIQNLFDVSFKNVFQHCCQSRVIYNI